MKIYRFSIDCYNCTKGLDNTENIIGVLHGIKGLEERCGKIRTFSTSKTEKIHLFTYQIKRDLLTIFVSVHLEMKFVGINIVSSKPFNIFSVIEEVKQYLSPKYLKTAPRITPDRENFPKLAFSTFGSKTIQTLERQYKEKGVQWMVKYWGYGENTIRHWLQMLNIDIYEQGWPRWREALNLKIQKLGGIDTIFKRCNGSVPEIASLLSCSKSKTCNLLHEAGYIWSKRSGWTKK